jgi:pimeloyl-ACP methyl ester carboxylesterase
VQDIASVVEWIQSKRNGAKVAILGWATGGQWAGYYATLHPHKVSHLILYNALYAGSNRHPSIGHGSDLEDPDHPGKFNFSRYGAYSFNPGNGLLHSWNNSIPIEDKSLWRDPVIADAYVKASLESDSTSSTRTPPSFRAPLGALEDSFYLATGRQLWDASFIQSPTLILRSERDFWSRQEDVDTLLKHMVHASGTRASIIPNATHYVHLDRMERGRARFILEVQSFISAQQTGNPHRS